MDCLRMRAYAFFDYFPLLLVYLSTVNMAGEVSIVCLMFFKCVFVCVCVFFALCLTDMAGEGATDCFRGLARFYSAMSPLAPVYA